MALSQQAWLFMIQCRLASYMHYDSLKLPCKDLKSVSYFSFNSFGTKYPSNNNVFMFPVGDAITISSWSSKPQIGVIFYHGNSQLSLIIGLSLYTDVLFFFSFISMNEQGARER